MVKIKSYAKINLGLHLLPKKLPNGLYPVQYINCQIALHDNINIKSIKNKIVITSNNKDLPKTQKNLVYRALSHLKKQVKNKNLGLQITLRKKIPVKAGFGGGSSNAAMVLIQAIKLWKVRISKSQLHKIAGNVGKEIFYFLKNNVCEVLYDGSVVNKISSRIPKIWIVAIGPKQKKQSTGYMFKGLNPIEIGKNLNKFTALKKGVLEKNKKEIIKNIHNDFESFALKKYPVLQKIKKDLIENNAVNAIMTGAGLYIIGYFNNKKTAQKAYNVLKRKYTNAIFTHTR